MVGSRGRRKLAPLRRGGAVALLSCRRHDAAGGAAQPAARPRIPAGDLLHRAEARGRQLWHGEYASRRCGHSVAALLRPLLVHRQVACHHVQTVAASLRTVINGLQVQARTI